MIGVTIRDSQACQVLLQFFVISLGCLQPSPISLFYFLFSSNQIALFLLENRIHVVTPLQKSYC